jgi:uncharacterized protein (DUF433 family)
MQLEDYFDFLRPDDIRVKGTRVGIETILYDFIYKSRRPEEIVQSYPTLTLEQVYATITYYLHKNEEVKEYIANWIAHGERMREEQNRNPTPAMLRLRAIAAEWRAREKEEQEKEASGEKTLSK